MQLWDRHAICTDCQGPRLDALPHPIRKKRELSESLRNLQRLIGLGAWAGACKSIRSRVCQEALALVGLVWAGAGRDAMRLGPTKLWTEYVDHEECAECGLLGNTVGVLVRVQQGLHL